MSAQIIQLSDHRKVRSPHPASDEPVTHDIRRVPRHRRSDK